VTILCCCYRIREDVLLLWAHSVKVCSMKRLAIYAAVIVLLGGCGGRAPIKRAHEVLFDVPYIQQKQQYESVSVGAKRVSVPEVKELFCDSDTLLKMYNVYYVRTHNTGNQTYTLQVVDQILPTRKEVGSFFNPHTFLHSVAHFLFIIPAGIGLSFIAPDPLSYFVGFIGLNLGLHIVESQSLGIEGYQEFEKHLLVADGEHRLTSITTIPCGHTHTLLFIPKRDVRGQQVTLTISQRNKMPHDLTFDFSEMQ
jgi:hypothetical protein